MVEQLPWQRGLVADSSFALDLTQNWQSSGVLSDWVTAVHLNEEYVASKIKKKIYQGFCLFFSDKGVLGAIIGFGDVLKWG